MFLGFITQRLASKHKFFSLRNLHASTILPTFLFFRKKRTLSHFLKNKQNSNPHPFCKAGWEGGGERDPAMINQNYLFHIFVTNSDSTV